MQPLFSCVIPGRPYVKKGTLKVYGKGRVVYSKQFKAWEMTAVYHIKRQLMQMPMFKTIKTPVHLRCIFEFENHMAEADLSALSEGIQDVLQDTGVIENDRLVHSHDGTRKIFNGRAQMRVDVFTFLE